MALNNVNIMGRLVADPEFKQVNDDLNVTSFRVAVDRDYVSKSTDKREADFFNCVAFRGTSKFVAQYFGKGDMIVVNGRLQSRSYQDQQGNNRTVVEIVCENCYFGSPKGGAANNDAASTQTQEVSEDTDLPF